MWVGDVVADRFEIERPIGSGGMGMVFLARDRTAGRPVAVKALDGDFATGADRFRREAELLESLLHPAIVRYVSHGETPGGPYLVMEFLEGEDLATRLLGGRVAPDHAVAIARRVAEGLAVAHSRGIVHRDIKPGNLFLVDSNPERLKIIDFGIAGARGLVRTLTHTGHMLGTVGYMAPEQVTGARDVGASADVFALGAVLFECLTGKPAFRGANAVVTMGKVMCEEPPRISEVVPEIGDRFDGLVAAMLEKNPAARPADGTLVVQAIDALGTGAVSRSAPSKSEEGAAEVHSWWTSVVLALPKPAAALSKTISVETAESERQRWSVVASNFGAALRCFADGGLVLEFSGTDAKDVTHRAVRCAELVHREADEYAVAVATGEHAEAGRMGAVIDAADEVLSGAVGARARGVLVDRATADLVSTNYDVVAFGNARMLIRAATEPSPTLSSGEDKGTLNVVAEERVRVRSPALQAFLSRPPEDRHLGPFYLRKPLGRGGFAPVWLATEVYDAIELRTAAVKLFAFDADDARDNASRHREHVVREARSLCQVEHPNIVRFYTLLIDDDAGVVGLAMEYLPGASLADRLRATGALDVAETMKIGVAVASALDAAHRAGIVHRDIKPANVMESPAGYKLIDFGIATGDEEDGGPPAGGARRTLPDEVPADLAGTRMTMVIEGHDENTAPVGVAASGTVGYIDPVCVALGARATASSDLYSLGALLFEVISGMVPAMAAAKKSGLSGQVLDGRAPAPRTLEFVPDAPPELAALIDRLLSSNRTQRPSEASEVCRALESIGRRLESRSTVPLEQKEALQTPRSNRRRIATAIAVASLGGLGALGLLRRKTTLPASTAMAAMPAVHPSSAIPAMAPSSVERRILRSKLPVLPGNAEVTVDGSAARRGEDGAIELAGEPGTSFNVVVKVGDRSRSERVMLLRDGHLEPERVELQLDERSHRRSVRDVVKASTTPQPSASARPEQPAARELVPKDEF